jgi:hypothetical protein
LSRDPFIFKPSTHRNQAKARASAQPPPWKAALPGRIYAAISSKPAANSKNERQNPKMGCKIGGAAFHGNVHESAINGSLPIKVPLSVIAGDRI